jgi:hypothetical protein
MSHLTNTQSFSSISSTGRKPQAGSAVLGFLMALLFSCSFLFLMASARKALLLRSVVRTRFQFVVLTGVAIEVKDFLRVFSHESYCGNGPSSFSPTVMRIAEPLGNTPSNPFMRTFAPNAEEMQRRAAAWSSGPATFTSYIKSCENSGSRMVKPASLKRSKSLCPSSHPAAQ